MGKQLNNYWSLYCKNGTSYLYCGHKNVIIWIHFLQEV